MDRIHPIPTLHLPLQTAQPDSQQQLRVMQPQVSVVLRLRNPAVKQSSWTEATRGISVSVSPDAETRGCRDGLEIWSLHLKSSAPQPKRSSSAGLLCGVAHSQGSCCTEWASLAPDFKNNRQNIFSTATSWEIYYESLSESREHLD